MDKNEILKKAKECLIKNNLTFEEDSLDTYLEKKSSKLRGGMVGDVYIIPYNLFIGNELTQNFIYFSISDEKFLYIITPRGYIEIDD